MKKIILLLIMLISLFSCKAKMQETQTENVKNSQIETSSQQKPFSFISDFSNVFTESQKDSLNLKLTKFEQKTTNEIAIFTLDSIVGNITTNAKNLGNTIGVGKLEKDNGLLILLVKPMRQVGIATGIGTMEILTDSICQNIIDQQMIPEFKNDNYFKGIDNAVDEIIKQWERE